jgi:hypothetical protein
MITCISACVICVNSETPSTAPKSRTAKPNNDCRKGVKVSINSPNYRSGLGGPIRSSTNNTSVAQVCPFNRCKCYYLLSHRLKINPADLERNMHFFLRMVLSPNSIWIPKHWSSITEKRPKWKNFYAFLYSSQNVSYLFLDKHLHKKVVLVIFLSKSKSMHLYFGIFLCIPN